MAYKYKKAAFTAGMTLTGTGTFFFLTFLKCDQHFKLNGKCSLYRLKMSKILSVFLTFTAFSYSYKAKPMNGSDDSVFNPMKCICFGTIFSESVSLKSLTGKSRGRHPAE